jgi:hypothetical protein
VGVPSGAAAGKATIRFELESSTGKRAIPADFEVMLK